MIYIRIHKGENDRLLAACDEEILGETFTGNGMSMAANKHKGIRAGCRCIETHDIGAYDTCLNGCKYCYANQNPRKAFENFRYHDPKSPLLLGYLKPSDVVTSAQQKSFLAKPTISQDASSQPDLF